MSNSNPTFFSHQIVFTNTIPMSSTRAAIRRRTGKDSSYQGGGIPSVYAHHQGNPDPMSGPSVSSRSSKAQQQQMSSSSSAVYNNNNSKVGYGEQTGIGGMRVQQVRAQPVPQHIQTPQPPAHQTGRQFQPPSQSQSYQQSFQQPYQQQYQQPYQQPLPAQHMQKQLQQHQQILQQTSQQQNVSFETEEHEISARGISKNGAPVMDLQQVIAYLDKEVANLRIKVQMVAEESALTSEKVLSTEEEKGVFVSSEELNKVATDIFMDINNKHSTLAVELEEVKSLVKSEALSAPSSNNDNATQTRIQTLEDNQVEIHAQITALKTEQSNFSRTLSLLRDNMDSIRNAIDLINQKVSILGSK